MLFRSVNPYPGRVPEQELMSPKLGFLMVAELEIVFGKILLEAPDLGHVQYIVRRASRGDARWVKAGGGRGPGPTHAWWPPGVVGFPLTCPSSSRSFLVN